MVTNIKLNIRYIAMLLLCIFMLSGCGASQNSEDVLSDIESQETDKSGADATDEDSVSELTGDMSTMEALGEESTQEVTGEEDTNEESAGEEVAYDDYSLDELLDAFLASEIPAFYDDEDERIIMYDQLPHDPEDFTCFSVGERIDLDNDGENEQILKGPYGGMYLDVRDGKVYVLAEGNGTAGHLSYTYYDNAIWIVYSDVMHSGRSLYWLTKYEGGENIVDEFNFYAEYWYSTDGKYDENSDFTYRDEKISMEKYEELRKEIFGW